MNEAVLARFAALLPELLGAADAAYAAAPRSETAGDRRRLERLAAGAVNLIVAIGAAKL